MDAVGVILTGKKLYPPLYEPQTRLVNHKNRIFFYQLNEGVCIVEGTIALDISKLRVLADVKIFMEIDDDIRKKRIIDFYVGLKNCTYGEALNILVTRESEEVPIIKSTMKYADIIFRHFNFVSL